MLAKADELGVPAPFIDRVLAVPDLELAAECEHHEGVPRARFATAGDLRGFARWWARRFANVRSNGSLEDARRIFESVFAIGLPATANRRTLDFADRIIEQQTECSYELMDALSENHQLLFNGGPGTGKTWLAIEQALRATREGARASASGPPRWPRPRCRWGASRRPGPGSEPAQRGQRGTPWGRKG